MFVVLQLAQHLNMLFMLFGGTILLTYLLRWPVNRLEFALRIFLMFLPINDDSKAFRVIGILIVYALLFLGLTIGGVQVVPTLTNQVKKVAEEVPGYLNKAEDWYQNIMESTENNGLLPVLLGSITVVNAEDSIEAAEKIDIVIEDAAEGSNSDEPIVRIQPKSITTTNSGASLGIRTTKKHAVPLPPSPGSSESTPIIKIKPVTTQKTIDSNTGSTNASDEPAGLASNLSSILKDFAKDLPTYLINFGTNTVTSLVYILTCLVMVFYLLLDGDGIRRGFIQLFRYEHQREMTHYINTIHKVLANFLAIQAVLAIISGVSMFVLLSAFQIEEAFLLSSIYGMASIVPIIGPWCGIIPIIAMVIFTGHAQSLIPILFISGLFYIIKTYWIIPKFFERMHAIHPILIILTFIVCIHAAHFSGAVFAFPLASVLSGTYLYFLNRQDKALSN